MLLNFFTSNNKFYEFHFAVVDSSGIKSLNILHHHGKKTPSKQQLKIIAMETVQPPCSRIMITKIKRLKRSEYEAATGIRLSNSIISFNHFFQPCSLQRNWPLLNRWM